METSDAATDATTLADLQRGTAARVGGPGPAGALPLRVERARTFNTPEFRGMTFLEVEAKTALNRVQGMPFKWSINPYRGCSHACSYCMSGDTPILMADGRTKPLADVRAGDRVYGTVRQGRSRRYVVTEVLDHWSTVKAAVRLTLADGTTLVASGEHRFLSDQGWKHVLPQPGEWQMHLSERDRLMGYGSDAGCSPRRGITVGTAAGLDVKGIEPLGVQIPMFDITTGTGDFIANGVVSHNCFARPTHTYLNLDPLGDFEKTIVVKANVVEVLQRELVRKSWKGEPVAMGTNTDPYQRCEGRYRLLPGIIKALARSYTPFSILTKGTLITRDLELLAAAARRVEVRAAFTIGMLDERLWHSSEPGTPSPQARLDAVRALNEAGIPTGVMLAPIMPGLNDQPEQLGALVDACAEAGATHVTPIVLHLRPGVRELFWPWLERTHPELVERYRVLYRGTTAAKAYRDEVEAFVRTRRRSAFRLRGGTPATEYRRGQPEGRPLVGAAAGDQLSLLD